MFIPKSLWHREMLHLPRDLDEVYRQRLESLNLISVSKSFSGGGQGGHGGKSQDDTHHHFACLFTNSASRVLCVLVNPTGVFEEVSHDLIMTLSSHRIALLDIPCGSGAGGIALLTTMKELRVAGVVPSTPLSVDIFAADFSTSAIDLYESQIALLRPRLATFGISVRIQRRPWDALVLQQTSDLIEDYLAHEANEYLVLMANFSGDGKPNFSIFKSSFDYIFARLSNRRVKDVRLLWIEPMSKHGIGFLRLLKESIGKFVGYKSKVKPDVGCITCKYSFFSYLQNKPVPSNVAVHDYKREDRP